MSQITYKSSTFFLSILSSDPNIWNKFYGDDALLYDSGLSSELHRQIGFRSMLASQVIVSAIAIPIILSVGLLETSILMFTGEGKHSFTRMVDSLKNHLFIFIPGSIVCLFSSMQKTRSFVYNNYGVINKYSNKISISSDNMRGVANHLLQEINFHQNEGLQELKIISANLTQAPDISGNPSLQTLHLLNNRLTQSPDVSGNPHLTLLILNFNELTNLHDSIITLPRHCIVDVQNNRFSAGYCQQFQTRLQQQRALDPSRGPTVYMSIHDAAANYNAPAAVAANTLETELNSWSGGFRSRIDFAPLVNLDENNRSTLLNYLGKLKHTADYEDLRDPEKKAKKNTIRRVENMLRLACQKPEFRDSLLGLMIEGNASCGDRVILLLNDIEVQWHIYHKEHNTQELADIAIKAQRYDLLKTHGKKEAVRRQLGDELETILAYQIKLTDDLQLPISTRTMLYPGMSGVTEAMLNTARHEIGGISKLDLLAQSELWRDFLKKENLPSFTAIINDFDERMENLDPEAMSDQEYIDACNALPAAKETALRQWAKNLTDQLALQLN